MLGVLSGARRLMPRALAAAAFATAAFATLGAEAQAATGYRRLCSGEYCFHVSNFMKSRGLNGSGLHDIWFYLSYGRLKPTHYNIRFRNAQGQEVQIEIPGEGARSAIRNLGVTPGRRYVIKSQACTRQLFGSSQCTRWYTTTFTAKSA